MRFVSAVRAAAPADGEVMIAGLSLPAGTTVIAEGGTGDPVGWVTNNLYNRRIVQAWQRHLAAAFPETGLWPLATLTDSGLSPLDYPWRDGECDGAQPITKSAEGFFRDVAGEEEDPRFNVTMLAPPTPGASLEPGELVGPLVPSGLVLIPTERPADVLARIGWVGAENPYPTGADISSVLRSWEDRFAVTLTSVGSDTIALQRPDVILSNIQLDLLLAEHYQFCSDIIDQGSGPDDYHKVLTSTDWGFWWD